MRKIFTNKNITIVLKSVVEFYLDFEEISMKYGFDRAQLWNNSELYTISLLQWNMQNKPVSENPAFRAKKKISLVQEKFLMDIRNEAGKDYLAF